jgi:hypothetical protein
MRRAKTVKPEAGYRLWVEFDDGLSGSIDLTPDLHGPMFEPLKDVRFFAQVRVDEFGVVCWPNGADLAPDALYQDILQAQAVAPKR